MKRTVLISIFLLISGLQIKAESINENIKQGDIHYSRFENKAALEIYKKEFESNMDNYDLAVKLVRAYNDVGEDLDSDESEQYFISAVKHTDDLVRLNPEGFKTYLYLSVSYGNLAMFKGGKKKVKLSRKLEKYAKKAREINPGDDRPYVILGVYYREVASLSWILRTFAKTVFGGLPSGSFEDSEKMLLKALEINPGNVYAAFELAKTYKKMKKPGLHEEYLNEVIDLPVSSHQDKQIKKEAGELINKK